MENTQANLMVLDNSTAVLTKEFKDLLTDTLEEVFNTANIEELKSVVVADTQTKEYKELIANARKLFTEQDNFRKELKKAVNEKYKVYEDLFKSEFKEPLEDVLNSFDKQVKEIEEAALNAKIEGLRTYLEVLTKGTKLEDVTLEQLNISKIVKSGSDKKYQGEIEAKVTEILNNLAAIQALDNSKYIEVEYKKDFNFARAIEAGKALAAELGAVDEHEQEELAAPDPAVEEETMNFTLAFKDVPTSKIKALKEFLAKAGISYEFI